MQTWYAGCNTEGFFARLVEVPSWALAVSAAAEAIDVATGHLWCGGGPSWFEKVPVGIPRYERIDGDALLMNSLGDLIYRSFCWLLSAPERSEHTLAMVAIDADTAKALGFELEE